MITFSFSLLFYFFNKFFSSTNCYIYPIAEEFVYISSMFYGYRNRNWRKVVLIIPIPNLFDPRLKLNRVSKFCLKNIRIIRPTNFSHEKRDGKQAYYSLGGGWKTNGSNMNRDGLGQGPWPPFSIGIHEILQGAAHR